jgi:pyroglutamyl-peptidase
MKTVLVTGFEPFDGGKRNPSQEIALALDGKIIGGVEVIGRVLPCVFGLSRDSLRGFMRDIEPSIVIALGQASGRTAVTPERVALNLDDARIPDNAGNQPEERCIVRGGPAAYWSTLPIRAIVAALRARNIPAEPSLSAGTFVCNHVFYGLMHLLRHRPGVKAGFIHVPLLPEQAKDGQPSLAFERMVEAVEIAVACAAKPSLRGARG